MAETLSEMESNWNLKIQVINIRKMYFFISLKNITWGFFQKIAFVYDFFPASANQLGIVNLLNSKRYENFLRWPEVRENPEVSQE